VKGNLKELSLYVEPDPPELQPGVKSARSGRYLAMALHTTSVEM
jgi:hypothetical protein